MPTGSGRAIPSDEPLFRHRTWLGVVVLSVATVAELLAAPLVPPGGGAELALRLLGWVCFVGYVTLRVWSVLYVGGRKGRELVTEGPYAWVRNPLYLGGFLFALSAAAFLEAPLLLLGALAAGLLYRLRVIPAEERALEALHGEAYRAYRERTPRLWPRRPAPTAAEPSRVLHLRGIRAEARKLWVACLMPPAALLLAHLRHAPWWPHLFRLP